MIRENVMPFCRMPRQKECTRAEENLRGGGEKEAEKGGVRERGEGTVVEEEEQEKAGGEAEQ